MSFTEDQIDEFQEVFRLFDTKGDGMIPVIDTFIICNKTANSISLFVKGLVTIIPSNDNYRTA